MKKGRKIWLIVATVLVLAGAVLFVLALQMARFDFAKLGGVEYTTNTYTVTEEFDGVWIDTNTADVKLCPSEDGTVCVETTDREKLYHSVEVKEGVLNVRLEDERKWYDHIRFFDIGKEQVTVYLPSEEYKALTVSISTGDVEIPENFSFEQISVKGTTGDVSCRASVSDSLTIQVTTGAVRVENASVGAMSLTTSTGRITVSSVDCAGDVSLKVGTGRTTVEKLTCRTLSSVGDTGSLNLKEVIASGSFSIERDTGDVTFDRCDASQLVVETSTGDVTGTLLSDKIFFAESDTGRIDVPNSMVGGSCEITTDTGDIRLSVVEK